MKKVTNEEVENDSKIALIYVRVSTQKQDPRSQIVRCKEYCKARGYIIEEVFEDRFSGGGNFLDRPEMKKMLEYVEKQPHKKYVVVFDDLKRFARDVQFHIQLRAKFRSYDLTPECLNFKFDETPEGYFIETVIAAQAELERHQNKRQVVQKMRARLVAGYYAFPAPLGYTKEKSAIHGTIDKPNAKGKHIKKALEQFADSRFLYKVDVARYLKDKKVLGKRNPLKYLDTVSRLLKNPFYAGYIEYLPWDVSRRKGHHKGLISTKTFEQIQARLSRQKNSTRTRLELNPAFPLRSCINCSVCLRPLTGSWSKGRSKHYAYYHCGIPGCPMKGKTIPSLKLSTDFRNLVESYTPKPEVVDYAMKVFNDSWDDNLKELSEDRKKNEELIFSKEQEISLIASKAAKTQSEIVEQEYEKQIENLASEVKALKNQTKNTEIHIPYRTGVEKVLTALKSPYKLWSLASLEEKQSLFYFLFEENPVYARNEGFRTARMCYPLRLFQTISVGDSVDVEMGSNFSNHLLEFLLGLIRDDLGLDYLS